MQCGALICSFANEFNLVQISKKLNLLDISPSQNTLIHFEVIKIAVLVYLLLNFHTSVDAKVSVTPWTSRN